LRWYFSRPVLIWTKHIWTQSNLLYTVTNSSTPFVYAIFNSNAVLNVLFLFFKNNCCVHIYTYTDSQLNHYNRIGMFRKTPRHRQNFVISHNTIIKDRLISTRCHYTISHVRRLREAIYTEWFINRKLFIISKYMNIFENIFIT